MSNFGFGNIRSDTPTLTRSTGLLVVNKRLAHGEMAATELTLVLIKVMIIWIKVCLIHTNRNLASVRLAKGKTRDRIGRWWQLSQFSDDYAVFRNGSKMKDRTSAGVYFWDHAKLFYRHPDACWAFHAGVFAIIKDTEVVWEWIAPGDNIALYVHSAIKVNFKMKAFTRVILRWVLGYCGVESNGMCNFNTCRNILVQPNHFKTKKEYMKHFSFSLTYRLILL